MKFYHDCPKSSLAEQLGLVKLWTVLFLSMVFSSHTAVGCNFSIYKPCTTTYGISFNNLSVHLPLDYTLTVMLLNHDHQDRCCVDLQNMLSFQRSLNHLLNHSVSPLTNITNRAILEAGFLEDCPVHETQECRSERWNATHLLQRLDQSMSSFDNLWGTGCQFENCTLFSCVADPLADGAEPIRGVTSPVVNGTSGMRVSQTASWLREGTPLGLLVISVIVNAVLVSYLLKKKKEQPHHQAEAETTVPLAVSVIEENEGE